MHIIHNIYLIIEESLKDPN